MMSGSKKTTLENTGTAIGSEGAIFVCLVDDEPAVLRATKAGLESVDATVLCFESAEAFLKSYVPGKVACLVVDYVLPGASGLELIDKLKDDPALQVVMLSGQGTISAAVTAMKSGAIEFLEKPYSPERLRTAVVTAIDHYKSTIANRADRADRERRLSKLTEGERAVAEASATGITVKEIAAKLDISARTVHMRLASAMKKTQVANKIELLHLICLDQLLQPPE